MRGITIAVLLSLALFVSGCTMPSERTSDPAPTDGGADARSVPDRLGRIDFLAWKEHRFGWKAACPAPASSTNDGEPPRLHITPSNLTFQAGDVQCFTVSFDNTADEPLVYTTPPGCHAPQVTLRVEGRTEEILLPVTLPRQDGIPCAPAGETHETIGPGQSFQHTFVWDGTGIIDGFGPPYLSAGTYTLVAELAGRSSWNVTTRLDVTIFDHPDHPAASCTKTPLDQTPGETPRMQIRLDDAARAASGWFCIPISMYNGSDRTFNVTTPSSCMEPTVAFHPLAADQPPVGFKQRPLCFQAFTTHTLAPGETWEWIYWWPGLDEHGGAYDLRVSLPAAEPKWDASTERRLTLT